MPAAALAAPTAPLSLVTMVKMTMTPRRMAKTSRMAKTIPTRSPLQWTSKPSIALYQILMSHIYSRKKTGTTVAGWHVDQLLTRAAPIGITLPPVQQRTTPYSVSELIGSTTR